MADYVVVGGGVAGCVIATRLSEDPDVRVLLIEAGPTDRNPYIHMPVGFARMTGGPLTWKLKTAPQEHAMGREIPYAQGRVLGGGGSINAQVFTRGRPADYDAWATECGCPGWGFEEVRRYFVRSEDNDTLAGAWHGNDGPLGVTTPCPQPAPRAFVRACQQYGMPLNPDFNGPVQAGTGPYQITTRDGRRCATARGYLRPAMGRANLEVRTGVRVSRILIEKGRATGVAIEGSDGAEVLRAGREVIVTAGAIGSPKLMMLSGLGPADHLRAHGIEVVADLAGVGADLQDHYGIDIVYETSGPLSLDKYNRWWWAASAGLEYALWRRGPVTSNIVEGGAFWFADAAAADDPAALPDLQFHFLVGAGVEAGVPAVPSGSGLTLNSYTLQPRARGSVRLRSARAEDAPVVDPNFLGAPEDLGTSIRGLEISREIMAQPALARFVKTEHFPSARVKGRSALEDYARRYGRTSYHPVGTCRMGGDEGAVVDPELRVRGIEGLRVCDSSVMPRLVSSNTNAPTVMIAEKASDLIRGRQ